MEEGKIVSWIKNVGDEVYLVRFYLKLKQIKLLWNLNLFKMEFYFILELKKDQTVKVNDLVAIISESKSIDKNFINEFINESNNTPKLKIINEDKEDKVEFKSNLIELPKTLELPH